jgi:hypothetical protein
MGRVEGVDRTEMEGGRNNEDNEEVTVEGWRRRGFKEREEEEEGVEPSVPS